CSRAMTKVGEVTRPSTPRPAAIPRVSAVLPAPSGPSSTTRSPARNSAASRRPNASVSSTVGSSMLCSPTCGPLDCDSPNCDLPSVHTLRETPLDQAIEGTIDDLGELQLHEVPGTTHPLEFDVGQFLRQRLGT